MMIRSHFILYVKDQEKSTNFYSSVLNCDPCLNVPGMTEFQLSPDSILGLMPSEGIRKLLNNVIPDPSEAGNIPRTELYIFSNDADSYLNRALLAGAELLSALENRDWGHRVAYVYDPDCHIVAFAEDARPSYL